MATETTKHTAQTEAGPRHSALEELYRDERRPALLLLSGLLIAVLFFALGIMVGRWMNSDNGSRPSAAPASTPQPSPIPQGAPQTSVPATGASASNTNSASNTTQDAARRYSLLIATFNTPEEAQPLIKRLEDAGYKDVRTSTPRASERQPKFSILVGHYTRDEADQLAARMRATGDPRLRYARVIEEQ
ncbi:MAG: SPOR domain-containing protein [Pyrinomonadaceae bacterium]|nr:SPOR domain-containing protein [Pyrinomonadaceae bacterium]